MLLGSCRRGTIARSTSNPNYSYRSFAVLTCSCNYFFEMGWGSQIGGFLFWRLFVDFGALNGHCY